MTDDETTTKAPEQAPPEPKKRQAKAERKSPIGWCKALANYRMLRRAGKRVLVPSWEHNAAKNLHQWGKHEHHAGAPIMLTKKEYESALKAATKTPLTPHKSALSKYAEV